MFHKHMFQERLFKILDGNSNKTASIFKIMIKMCGKDFNEILFQEKIMKFSFKVIIVGGL